MDKPVRRAMILAAGRGTRMRPLTDTCPKPMLTLAGKPLIFYHLEKLAGAGVEEVVINHAWLGEVMREAIGDGARFGVKVHWSAEPAGGLETAGGVIRALPLLGDAPFLVVNGDVWSDFDYAELSTLPPGDLGHLVLVSNPAHHQAGDFTLQGDRVGLPASPEQDAAETFTFAGISLLSPALFSGLDDSFRKLKPLFECAIASQQLSARVHHQQWCDVGTPERYTELDALLSRQTSTNLE